MPDLVAVAIIPGVSSIIGGAIGAAIRPWREDWVARRRGEREQTRARLAQRRERLLQRMETALHVTDDAAVASLRSLAASIVDPNLTDHVGRFLTASNPIAQGIALGDARLRIDELIHEESRR